MLVHVNHGLWAFNLLNHIDLELRDCHQISATQVVKVHDATELAIALVEHGSDEIFVANRHINEVLTVVCSDPAAEIKISLAEIDANIPPSDFSADCYGRLKLIFYHGQA